MGVGKLRSLGLYGVNFSKLYGFVTKHITDLFLRDSRFLMDSSTLFFDWKI